MEKLPIIVEDLKDKVVVITGAGGVICSTLAKSIALSGAKVALLDLNLEQVEIHQKLQLLKNIFQKKIVKMKTSFPFLI